MKVHFIGICGSGQSAIAIMAKNKGFDVDGCDININNNYSKSLEISDIKVKEGHNSNHLIGVDICAVSPAIFDIDPHNEEVKVAKSKGILMTWQEFMGKYILDDQELIAVAGTHGKSTTTVMLGRVLEELNAEPNVISGAIYSEWNSGCRIGNSNLFVCEADEFNKNFLNYQPSIIVINNMEMDHPECYASPQEMSDAFGQFIHKIRGRKLLVVNAESKMINNLLKANERWISQNEIKVIGYFCDEKQEYDYFKEVRYQIIESNENTSVFMIEGNNKEFSIPLLGKYNVENAMGVIAVTLSLNYDDIHINEALQKFKGINRRFQLVGVEKGISVYDDYAHHPTAIKSVLEVCNQIKRREVWTVFEPHQISRLRLMFDDFAKALNLSEHVIITKTYIGREVNSNLDPISEKDWINAIGKNKTFYFEEYNDVVNFVCKNAKKDDLIIVIGAGESYKISTKILERLK